MLKLEKTIFTETFDLITSNVTGYSPVSLDLTSPAVTAGSSLVSFNINNGLLEGPHMLGGAEANINGTAGNDALFGTIGNDFISGLAGDDQLSGLRGDDILNGGAGNDILNGGIGVDTASYTGLSSGVTVSLAVATQDTIGAGFDTLISIENLDGSGFNDTLTGNAGRNRIDGGDGNDIIDGADGDDNLSGQFGNDTVSGGAGDDEIRGGDGNDILEGGSGDDELLGNDDDDTLTGGAGNDDIVGGDGADVAVFTGNQEDYSVIATGNGGFTITDNIGSEATDTLTEIETIQFADGQLLVNTTNNFDLSQNNDDFTGTSEDDVISAMAGDDQIDGFGGHDTISGGSGDDNLNGGTGDDILSGGDGNDVLTGGAGTDTASYGNSTSAVSVDLSFGGAQNTLGAGVDTLIEIENLRGSSHDDSLTGDAGDNFIVGNAGNDVIRGGLGADILNGGDGIDTVSYEGSGSTGGVNINLATGDASLGDAQGDVIVGFENIIGSSFNDTLTGDSGDNTISGNTGNDYIEGGDGADVLNGEGGLDTLSYESSNSAVIVDLTAQLASGGDANGDIISSFENVTGSAHDDHLTAHTLGSELRGGAGDDSLNGGAGNDTIYGESGNDMIDGGIAIDTMRLSGNRADYSVAESAGVFTLTDNVGLEGTDTVTNVEFFQFDDGIIAAADLLGGSIIDGTSGNDVINGTSGNDRINGLAGNDRLFGEDGVDFLTGGAGDDFMSGGLGTDVFIGGEGNDLHLGGGGVDTISYADSSSRVVFDLTLNGAGGTLGDAAGDSYFGVERAVGSEFNDHITGATSTDILRGGDGDDYIYGGTGGYDSLFGDGGVDSFGYHTATGGRDLINDFQAGTNGEVIYILGGDTNFDTFEEIIAVATDNADGSVSFNFGHPHRLTLKDVQIADLVADNFDFSGTPPASGSGPEGGESFGMTDFAEFISDIPDADTAIASNFGDITIAEDMADVAMDIDLAYL